MDISATYSHDTTCSNCGHHCVHRIPKGQTIDSYVSACKCESCGCLIRRAIPMPRLETFDCPRRCPTRCVGLETGETLPPPISRVIC